MTYVCAILLAFLSGLAAYISRGLSWLLDNFAKLAEWWAKVSAEMKKVYLAVATLIVGGAAMALGTWVLPCEGWPIWTTLLVTVLTAALSWFVAGKRHEEAKRGEAEATIQRQAAQIDELTARAANLEYQLKQAQRV